MYTEGAPLESNALMLRPTNTKLFGLFALLISLLLFLAFLASNVPSTTGIPVVSRPPARVKQ